MSNDDLLVLADRLYELVPETGTLGRTKAVKELKCSVEDYLAAKNQLVIEGRVKKCKGRCGPIARKVAE